MRLTNQASRILNHVAYISIKLSPYSALNEEIYQGLKSFLQKAEENHDVHVLVISIYDEIFQSSKGKRKLLADSSQKDKASFDYKASDICMLVKKLSKPVIAAIYGVAIGGVLELALACDLRICSERAKFAFPEINLAILPSGGGTQRLQSIVGQAQAKELLYFGTMINAQKAMDIKLVNLVVPSEDMALRTKHWAERLAKQPVASMIKLKEWMEGNFVV